MKAKESVKFTVLCQQAHPFLSASSKTQAKAKFRNTVIAKSRHEPPFSKFPCVHITNLDEEVKEGQSNQTTNSQTSLCLDARRLTQK